MAIRKQSTPPRALAVGDVVAAPSRELGAWTAAQIIRLDAESETAAVLELDWSGPEPFCVVDLGEVAPLVLTHHSWNGTLSYGNIEWVLPRSHKVIGALPLLHGMPSNSWSSGWRLGDQLARQRRWDSGVEEDPPVEWRAEYTGAAVDELLDQPTAPQEHVTELTIREIDSLDCSRLVRLFPSLTRLHLHGRLGLLSGAGELNRLGGLQRIGISDLYGMSADDCLHPRTVPELESLDLYGIPAAYASAMRRAWRPEIPAGTYVSVLRARKPEWVEENRNNPLRGWDGCEHIGAALYKRAVAQYKATRQAVLEEYAHGSPEGRQERLEAIGRGYGEAFNKLDRRAQFIETVEREDLFEALDHLAGEAEALHGPCAEGARDHLCSGADSVRDW
ncbi:hypothetical protein H9Y04_15750 [Streptomyces sp. TRM66268-LWL]|uniref:Uncharacterized protein n=1 Tax=Streptomyces polyasparticus TaxID=2767826 RepID=A0ABR7SEV2_9ACTN|nr:hypothetical protein [Streptomyces polyasparticus]MBC9714020.1 hypothetical protein [Streptomyces polyasparticus]